MNSGPTLTIGSTGADVLVLDQSTTGFDLYPPLLLFRRGFDFDIARPFRWF